MSRAQLKHVLIDVDFFTNPKIGALHRRFGDAGQLAIIQIYSAMSMATNGVIDEDAILYIVDTCRGVESPESFIPYCLDKGLIIKELNGYSNSRVIADQESLFKSQERYKRHRENNVVQTSQRRESLNTELLNNEDLKNDLKEKSLEILELPERFDTPEIRKALNDCQKRMRKSGRELDQIMLDSKIMTFGSPAKLLQALTHTAGLSKSKNIYSPPEERPPPQGDKKTNYEKTKDILKKYAEREGL